MKLSIIIPSKWPRKLLDLFNNLEKTCVNFEDIELVILIDEGANILLPHRKNIKFIREPKHDPNYISKLFEKCYRESSGDWIILGNDDILFETPNWDEILVSQIRWDNNPYKLYYFDDGQFRSSFSCHPVCSRELWGLLDRNGLIFGSWKNMGCDTTFWDTVPNALKWYMPEIKIKHMRHMDDDKIEEMNEDYENYTKDNYKREAVKDYILELNAPENRVLVGLSTGEYIRQANFVPYLLGLHRPANSQIISFHGQSPAQARNSIIDAALKGGFSHAFFIDDDMAIPPDTLMQLLQHDKDVVLGNYLQRSYPHRPVLFDQAVGNGWHRYLTLNENVHNLQEVTNGGFGCALVKTEVFKKIEAPWVTLGQIVKDGWSDDIGFFNRVNEAGYKIYSDPRAICGHMASVTVWPSLHYDGKWYTEYKYGREGQVKFPSVQ